MYIEKIFTETSITTTFYFVYLADGLKCAFYLEVINNSIQEYDKTGVVNDNFRALPENVKIEAYQLAVKFLKKTHITQTKTITTNRLTCSAKNTFSVFLNWLR